MLRTSLLATSLLATSLSASPKKPVLAIIDSGIDYKHEQLSDQIWINPKDSNFNDFDEDLNGFPDDVYGWNFFANSPDVIDYKYIRLYSPEITRFFEIQAAAVSGTATQEDLDWAKGVAQDQAFISKLMTFGNFVHGTHVAGISESISQNSDILAIKLMPTENPLFGMQQEILRAAEEGKSLNWIVKQIVKGGLFAFAKIQASLFHEIGKYVNSHDVDVVNGSFGIGPAQAKAILVPLLTLANGGNMPPQETVDEMMRFFLQRTNAEQLKLANASKATLFVFAAGNDGLSNDIFPTAPASMDHPRRLSVAAVFENGQLAPFSNFGESVDVAAPGVAIKSAVPDDRYMKLSGTSQAAPLVAGVASEIKAINPTLTATQIKQIILATVDVKTHLKGKVASSGVINPDRAFEAARLSSALDIEEAIEEAKLSISDIERPRSAVLGSDLPFISIQPSFYKL